MKKPIVGLDLDGVVVEMYIHLHGLIEKDYGPVISYDEISDIYLGNAFNLDRAKIHKVFAQFEKLFPAESLNFKPDAQRSIGKIKDNFDLAVITSRHDKFKTATEIWVKKNLGDYHIYYSRAPGLEEFSSPGRVRKSQIAKSIGAICLIEDSPYELTDWNEPNVAAICNARPWNKNLLKLRPDIPRLAWPEIVLYLDDLAKRSPKH